MFHDLIGKEIAGKYRVDKLIRETELGDFYQGTNTVTGFPVTVKVLAPAMAIDQRYVERFLADAKAGAQVSHPNILNSLDVGRDALGVPFAIYEASECESLAEIIRREGSLDVPRAVSFAKQIATAIRSAHAAGLVHAGLNPQKVLVTAGDNGESVKVFDFGVRPHARNSMSAVSYLAPELCLPRPTADERSDIFSLGIMLFEMLAGEKPYSGATPADIIAKQTNVPPPPLSAFRQDLPQQLEPIILSAIARDPDRRYQLMGDLEEDLGRIAGEVGANIPDTTIAVAAAADAQGARRNFWQTALIALAGVSLLGAALIYATSVRQSNPTVNLAPDANSLPVQPINPATGAQEDALAKLGDIGDASLVPNGSMELPGTVPGGDGFNAWANGGVPPAGAPLPGSTSAGPPVSGPLPPQYIPPGGQTVTVDPNGGSQFMPNEGGVILVPVPKAEETPLKPTPTPKSSPANVAVKPSPEQNTTPAANTAAPAKSVAPAQGPKPLMTPPKKNKPAKKPNED